MTTSTPNSATNLETLRTTGGGDIPVTQAPPQKQTDKKLHYSMCTALLLLGILVLAAAILGMVDTPYLNAVFPALLLISPFFLVPGFAGLYRGPGEPSTHVIPRPKNRKPIDPTAGAGGAAGPAPAARA